MCHCNTEVFQAFLNVMAEEVPAEAGEQVHLVLDNASWHRSVSLDWHHIKPFYLSAYSPDFNPLERLWQHMKGGPMAGFLTNDGEMLGNRLLDDSKLVQSVCALPSFNRK